MLKPWLLLTKTIFIISILKSVTSWNPACLPCRCFDGKSENPQRTTDCSSSIIGAQLTIVPQLQTDVQSLYLVGQPLGIITQNAFFNGAKNELKYLNLKNCQVRQLHDHAFRNLEFLSKLDLSSNQLTNLPDNVFDWNQRLDVLILQHNKFKQLPESLFNKLQFLKYLDLSENELHYISPNQFSNNVHLERLILQSNYLTKLDHGSISNLRNLKVLYLDDNPWKCDCQTKDLQKLIIERKIDFVYRNNYPTCSKPQQWKGRKWLEVKPKDLCSVEATPTVTATESENFDVSCTLNTARYVTVEWLRNGIVLDTNNKQKYSSHCAKNGQTYVCKLNINNINSDDAGVYKCWSSNLKGSDIQYDETNLNIQQRTTPIIDGPANQKSLVKNGEVGYSVPCVTTARPIPKVEWLFNGNVLSLSENKCKRSQSADNTLVFSQVNPSCFGNYTCRATNSKGVSEKNYEIAPLPQTYPKVDPFSNIDNNDAYEGTSVSLNCFIDEQVKFDVQWMRNGQVVTPNSRYGIKVEQSGTKTYNYILTITGISFAEAGNYKCRANTIESQGSYNLNVKPGNLPIIEEFENQNEITLDSGDSKDIPCKASGTPKPTITWEVPQPHCNKDSFVQGETLHLKSVTCSGKYKCIVTNAKGRTEKEFNLVVETPKISSVRLDTDYSDKRVFEYEDITLTCLVEAGVASKPFWEFNNGRINPNYKYELFIVPVDKKKYYYNLIIKNIAAIEAGNYKCRIGQDSKTVTVKVETSKPATIDNIPESKTDVESGTKDFKLECRVSGSHANVAWTSTNRNCQFDQSVEDRGDHKVAVLLIKEIDPSCKGQFKCSVNNKNGNDEKIVDLNVVTLQPPEPEVETNSANQEVVENDEVILKCLIRGAVISEPKWLFKSNFDPNRHRIVKQEISKTSYWYNLVIKNLKLEDSGNYKCVIGNLEQIVPLHVKPIAKPIIEYISNAQTIEAGRKNFRVACKVTGSPKPNTTWLKQGNFDGCKHEITREVTGSNEWIYLTIPEVTSACSGRYTCVATNARGEEKLDVDVSVISTDEPPEVDIDSFGFDNNVIENENVTLKCFVKTHIFEPRWLYQGQVISNNNKYQIIKVPVNQTSYWFNLVIFKISQQNRGSYKCRINNVETETLLNVQPSRKPVIDYISKPSTVEEGKKDFTLTCKVDGVPKPKVHWYYEGQKINFKSNNFDCTYNLASAGNPTDYIHWLYLTIADVKPSCAGKYKCVAENFKGGEETEIDVSVVSTKRPEIIEPPKYVFENGEVTLQCLIKDSVDSKPRWLHNNQPIIFNGKTKYITMNPIDGRSYWYNLILKNISPRDKGNYKCKINNLETTVNLDVQTPVKPTIEYPSNKNPTVEEGTKNFRLSCKVPGVPKQKVSWQYDGNSVSIENNCKYRITTELKDNSEWLYLTIPEVTPSCAGKFKCVTENSKGDENEITLTVNTTSPEIIKPPREVFEKQNVTLQCLVKGSTDSRPRWLHNNQPIEANTPNRHVVILLIDNDSRSYWYNLELKNISPNDAGKYKCKVNNLETEIPLVIQPGARAHISRIAPPNLSVEEGTKQITLPCQAIGKPAPEIIWLYENVPIDKIKNNYCQHRAVIDNQNPQLVNLIIQNINSSCAGKYKCISKNFQGTSEREVDIRVTTIPPPSVEVVPTSGNEVLENGEVTLKCLVSSRRYSAEWYKGNDLVIIVPNGRYSISFEPVNETAYWHNLVITKLLPTDKGDYKCKINNYESTVKLDVQKPVKPIIEYVPPQDTVVVEGTKNFKLACKVSGVPKPEVTWQYNDNTISSQSKCKHTITSEKNDNSEWLYLTILEVTPSCSGVYICTTKNSVGTERKEISLSVSSTKQTPQVTMTSTSSDGIIRENDDVTLKCLSTGNAKAIVEWYYKKQPIDFRDLEKYQLNREEVNQLTRWSILTIKNVTLQDQGDYSCKVNGVEQSYNIDVERALIPTVEYFSYPKLIIDEDTEETVLPCKVTDIADYVAEWTFNGKPLEDSDCNSETSISYEKSRTFEWYNLTITNITSLCSGQYKCVVRNLGIEDKNAIDITVLPFRPLLINITSSSVDDMIREHDSVTLKCFVTSSHTNAAKWIYKGQVITSNDRYKITKLIVNDTNYWYNLEMANVATHQSGDYKCSTEKSEIVRTLIVMQGFKPYIERTSNTEVIVEEGINEVTLFCKANGWPVPTLKWAHQSTVPVKAGDCKLESNFDGNSLSRWNYLKVTNISPSCSGRFICFAKNTKGYADQVINLTVIPTVKPEITINSTSPDNIIREGDDVTLSCLATGKSDILAKWYFKAKYGDNDNGNFKFKTYEINPLTYKYDLIIKNITFDQAGKYDCRRGTAGSNIDIEVRPGIAPIIEQFPTSNSVVIYTGAKLSTIFCKVSGLPRPSVTWFLNGNPLRFSNQNKCKYQLNSNNNWHNLTIRDADPVCFGLYKCVAKSFKGISEKEVSLRVMHPRNPVVQATTIDGSGIIKENDKVTLTCLVTGDYNTDVVWLYKGKIIKIDNNHKIIKEKKGDTSFWYNLQIERIGIGHDGTYQCRTPNSQSDIKVTVEAVKLPRLITSFQKIYVASGTKELKLSCRKDGIPFPSGFWEYNNSPLDGLSSCRNGCQYKISNTTNTDTFHLTLTNVVEQCTGKYKCIAQNTEGKTDKIIDVIVVPPGQPDVHIPEPVHAILNTDVTITCKVSSVDQPIITWRKDGKIVDFNTNKYVNKQSKAENNLHYSYFTIFNFQQSDFGDYSCEGKLDTFKSLKIVTLKDKQNVEPTFENPTNVWQNFIINNGDLIFTTKVRAYPTPKLEWKLENVIVNLDKTKYLSEVSYISNDQYWFNQTIKNFDSGLDTGRHQFTASNQAGEATKFIDVNVEYTGLSKRIEIFVDPPTFSGGVPS